MPELPPVTSAVGPLSHVCARHLPCLQVPHARRHVLLGEEVPPGRRSCSIVTGPSNPSASSRARSHSKSTRPRRAGRKRRRLPPSRSRCARGWTARGPLSVRPSGAGTRAARPSGRAARRVETRMKACPVSRHSPSRSPGRAEHLVQLVGELDRRARVVVQDGPQAESLGRDRRRRLDALDQHIPSRALSRGALAESPAVAARSGVPPGSARRACRPRRLSARRSHRWCRAPRRGAPGRRTVGRRTSPPRPGRGARARPQAGRRAWQIVERAELVRPRPVVAIRRVPRCHGGLCG